MITTLARKDSQARINSAFAELGKARSDIEIGAFIENIYSKFGQDDSSLDKTLFTVGAGGKATYHTKVEDMKASDIHKLYITLPRKATIV